jgi:hypothetical protein
MEVASFGFTPDEVSLVCDPPPDWFSDWVSAIPPDCWMAVDIETALKAGEGEDDLEVPVGSITRVNFSHHPDQGITVPWDPRYLDSIRQALLSPCTKVFWNERYDIPILEANSYSVSGPVFDGMWAWHLLQSNLPKSLGFVSPFYSNLPPWKHLSGVDESHYGAMDGVQQLRCMFGIARDLEASGQWEAFLKYVVQLDSQVLHPMSSVGILLDSQRLLTFQSNLKKDASAIWEEIQSKVPNTLKPLSPKGGWKRKPKIPPEGLIEMDVEIEVLACDSCGQEGVSSLHSCPEGSSEGA